jgi:hypothetical protein
MQIFLTAYYIAVCLIFTRHFYTGVPVPYYYYI